MKGYSYHGSFGRYIRQLSYSQVKASSELNVVIYNTSICYIGVYIQLSNFQVKTGRFCSCLRNLVPCVANLTRTPRVCGNVQSRPSSQNRNSLFLPYLQSCVCNLAEILLRDAPDTTDLRHEPDDELTMMADDSTTILLFNYHPASQASPRLECMCRQVFANGCDELDHAKRLYAKGGTHPMAI